MCSDIERWREKTENSLVSFCHFFRLWHKAVECTFFSPKSNSSTSQFEFQFKLRHSKSNKFKAAAATAVKGGEHQRYSICATIFFSFNLIPVLLTINTRPNYHVSKRSTFYIFYVSFFCRTLFRGLLWAIDCGTRICNGFVAAKNHALISAYTRTKWTKNKRNSAASNKLKTLKTHEKGWEERKLNLRLNTLNARPEKFSIQRRIWSRFANATSTMLI